MNLDPANVKALGLSSAGESAIATLASAAHFGGWATGAAASPTPVVVALRVLVAEKNAVGALELVLGAGTLAGRAMALAGLWDLDRPAFERGLTQLKAASGSVRVMTSGCAVGGDLVPLSHVLDDPAAVRLEGPGDSLSAWSNRNPGRPMAFDIVGGGYTAVMRAK